MRVFVTGATGFVGRALVQRLLGAGHSVTAWVRDPARARQRLGPDVRLCGTAEPRGALIQALSESQAVVHLAGENVLAGSWSRERRAVLASSRVDVTTQLTAAIAEALPRPGVLLSASAVGYYGDGGANVLTEQSPAGSGFLAQLCVAWERAALAAESGGLRVALLRIGIVLGPDGGALAAMLPAFRLGLGGPLGSGEQYVPFIQLDDLLSVMLQGLTDTRITGPINCTAPAPLTSQAFAEALGAAVSRPARLKLPSFALRMLLGERSTVVLQSQRAVPRVLEQLGFAFRFAALPDALAHCLEHSREVSIRRAQPDDLAGKPKRPSHVLEHHSRLHVSRERAFEFFCRAENLGLITPSWMGFELLGPPSAAIRENSELRYRIALGPFPVRWRTIIRRWEPPHGFVDMQASGPYALWWHEHWLEADGENTAMIDRVSYRLPFGALGRFVHWLVVERMLRAIFAYRADAITRLFGADPVV